MKQKVWVVNSIHPLVFKDDTCKEVDFTKNKRNMKLDTYTQIFTSEKKFNNYMENNKEHDYKFVNVCENEIETYDHEPDTYYTVVVTEVSKAKDENGLNKVRVKTYGVTPDKELAYKLRSSIEKDYADGGMGSDIIKYEVDVTQMTTWVFDDL